MLEWLFALWLVVGATTTSDYVGAEVCRPCHERVYRQWRQSPHARAEDGLAAGARSDPRCFGCHATPGLRGVQCEACHGPGRSYAAQEIMSNGKRARELGLVEPGEAVCRRCHTPDTPASRAYDHAAMLPLVNHTERW